MTRGRGKHVIALVVLPDSVLLEVALAQQVFGRPMTSIARVTGEHDSPYEIVLCGESRRHILPSGADMGDLHPLEVLETADTVIVPGVEDPLAGRSEALLGGLARAYRGGARMVSFCGGAFVLGHAGILNGRRATTHWLLSAEFRALFPLVRLEAEHLYVDDGSVHTSGGVLSGTDLALHLLALDLGQSHANDVGRMLVSAPNRSGGQSQFVRAAIRTARPTPIDALLSWIRDNIDRPLTLAQLAEQHHVSERTLVRRFRQETGMSVYDWLTKERVAQAQVLLETSDFRVSEIAAMVGFGSSESMRRNFERHVGTTAASYRETFRTAS